ncbi:MAG TPA: single-stranded DNA-binding protein [Firmicutes bacterium]|nr:single-stranded DNA-binding protein [Bacillota bacterium]
MAGVNRVFLIGHVGRDAEVRYTNNGQAVASFSLATTESWGGRDGGERQERTEWHNIVVWARQAEIAGQYVKKGRQLYVEGRLQTRDWVDPQGVKHYKTEIVANKFQFLGRREDYESSYGSSGGGQAPPRQEEEEDYNIGDLGPPLDMDDNPLSPGD